MIEQLVKKFVDNKLMLSAATSIGPFDENPIDAKAIEFENSSILNQLIILTGSKDKANSYIGEYFNA